MGIWDRLWSWRRRRAATMERWPPVASADFPALAEVISGYLHEDFLVEHGSAEGAIRAFRVDASAEERGRFDADVERMLGLLEGVPLAAARRVFVEDFRSAWIPHSLDELESVLCPPDATGPARAERHRDDT